MLSLPITPSSPDQPGCCRMQDKSDTPETNPLLGFGEAIKCVLLREKARFVYATVPAGSSGYYDKQGKAVFIYNMKACLSWTSITTTWSSLFNKSSLEHVRAKALLTYCFLHRSAHISQLRKASTTNMLLIEIS